MPVSTFKRGLPGQNDAPTIQFDANADVTDVYAADGFPNGSRFGDDVLDIAVTAAIADLRVGVDQGGFADVGTASNGAALGDFPYRINPNPGTTDPGPGPAASVGASFADDDPECLADGECIL